MKKTAYIIFFLVISTLDILSQGTTLDNTGGKINNLGTIKVKSGQVKALPDTIGGRVEFLQNIPAGQQWIPNIVYNQLVIKNKSKKIIGDDYRDNGTVRNLTIMDSLIVDDSTEFTSRWIGLESEDVHAKASVRNNAKYRGPKYLVMKGENSSQDLDGNGSFSNLMIQNPDGVNVINGGGFDVRESLVLREGILRNDADNNFAMADSSEIVRYTGAELAAKPQFGSNISVRYRGTGEMTTSGEIPEEEDKLDVLDVANSGGIDLATNTTANDSVIVNASIRTGIDTLTLTSNNDPIFEPTYQSEIAGTFRRNNITHGDTLIMNNPYTYAYFKDSIALNAIKDFAMTVTPGEHPQFPQGEDKVLRSFTINAWNGDGEKVNNDERFDFDFAYGWRHNPGDAVDESNGLPLQDIVLQRWIGNDWFDYESDPAGVDNYGWAYSIQPGISKFGTFGLGLPGYTTVLFAGKVLLEGPYIANSDGRMHMDLWQRGLLTQAPPSDQYPLNLDPNYDPDNFSAVPDSVVDWLLLEFREDRNAPASAYKTAFLRYDGTILDMDGSPAIGLSRYDGIDSGGGAYHVVVRHRNHNPIVTQDRINIFPENNSDILDLTNVQNIEGGTAAMKLLEITATDRRVWGLRGGYYANNNDQTALDRLIGIYNEPTTETDHRAAWNMFTNEGYLLQDYDLNGIVTTRDFNVSWNNR